jgi:hypothetical protein
VFKIKNATQEITKSAYAGHGKNTTKAVLQGMEGKELFHEDKKNSSRTHNTHGTERAVTLSSFVGCGTDSNKKMVT